MTASSLIALLPIIVLGAGATLMLLIIAFRRRHGLMAGAALVVLLLALVSIPIAMSQLAAQVTPLLVMDGYAFLIIGLLLVTSILVTLLSYGYLRLQLGHPEEYYVLIVTATLGASVLAASTHFASFFLGLEILSISLYAMIGYTYETPRSVEASIKYLILAGASSAFLLFGMALVYGETGTLEFARITGSGASSAPGAATSVFLLTGFVMMLVGFGFKLALVPFHLWTPDVYEGAPAPVSAFVATISKGSMFAILMRFFSPFNVLGHLALLTAFVIVAIASMLIGSLLALLQPNLKRLLAYSSIANLGYLLVAFLAGGQNAITSSTFFLASYFVSVMAAFGVVAVLSARNEDADRLENYRGLMWRRPWLAAILAVSMFSLAGIPLTAGFLGKFFIVLAGVGSALWLLVIVLIISSAIGLYYYLRVVVQLFLPAQAAEAAPVEAQPRPPALVATDIAALAGLLILLIWLGVFPAPILNVIQQMALGAR